MRVVVLMAVLLSWPDRAWAEWQIKSFLGVTFAGGTNYFADLEQALGQPKAVIGLSTGLVGEVFGVEIDVGHGPGFFEAGKADLVLKSSMTTMTGNVTVALPRRMTEYTLRPYFVGGAGLMHPSTKTFGSVFELSRNMPAVDLGAGVTGFVSRRVGIGWDVRRFQSIRGNPEDLTTDGGAARLSFWRANMALAIRY